MLSRTFDSWNNSSIDTWINCMLKEHYVFTIAVPISDGRIIIFMTLTK